jgi:osmotically-inducible protein OsmY
MTDRELKRQVESALDRDPWLDASDIGVSVDEGVVTLRGNVASYAEKMAAERFALRVFGVQAVANDLAVHLPSDSQRTDTEIAQAVVAALQWNSVVPKDRVTATVTNGWLTLNGTLDWQYQKDAAGRAVRDLVGVKGVGNGIQVRPSAETLDVRDRMEADRLTVGG